MSAHVCLSAYLPWDDIYKSSTTECSSEKTVWRQSQFYGFWESTFRTTCPGTSTQHPQSQQRLYFLRVLKNYPFSQRLFVSFYRCSVECTLTYRFSVRFSSCTAPGRRATQMVFITALMITGCTLSYLNGLYSSCSVERKAQNVPRETSYLKHSV